MAELVELQIEGGTICVEAAAGEAASRDFDASPMMFEHAIGGVRAMAKGIQEALASAKPDAMTVEFGLSMSGSGNFFIAKGETAANLKVTMVWGK